MVIALVASVVVTLGIYYLPFGPLLGRPLVLLSTLAHELGHGLTALAVGGSFGKLVINPDASGVAWTAVHGPFREAAVAAGGLVGPAVVAALCFLTGRSARSARLALGGVAALLLVVALVWVDNLFGFIFVTALGVVFIGVAWRLGEAWARFVVVFLGVQLSLAVFSRSDYLFTPTARTSQGVMPSDVAKMAQALPLPYWAWGGLCGAFSVVVLITGLWLSLRREGGLG